jgi:hypothetical protein
MKYYGWIVITTLLILGLLASPLFAERIMLPKWQEDAYAEAYVYEIATDYNFTDIIMDGEENTNVVFVELDPGTYYVRIAGKVRDFLGDWSAPRQIVVEAGQNDSTPEPEPEPEHGTPGADDPSEASRVTTVPEEESEPIGPLVLKTDDLADVGDNPNDKANYYYYLANNFYFQSLERINPNLSDIQRDRYRTVAVHFYKKAEAAHPAYFIPTFYNYRPRTIEIDGETHRYVEPDYYALNRINRRVLDAQFTRAQVQNDGLGRGAIIDTFLTLFKVDPFNRRALSYFGIQDMTILLDRVIRLYEYDAQVAAFHAEVEEQVQAILAAREEEQSSQSEQPEGETPVEPAPANEVNRDEDIEVTEEMTMASRRPENRGDHKIVLFRYLDPPRRTIHDTHLPYFY